MLKLLTDDMFLSIFKDAKVGGEYRSYRTFLHPYSASARVCSNSAMLPIWGHIYPNCTDTALILSHFPYSQVWLTLVIIDFSGSYYTWSRLVLHFEELRIWRNPRWSPSQPILSTPILRISYRVVSPLRITPEPFWCDS